MSKTMKNSITYSFILLGALALGIVVPNEVSAERPGSYRGYNEPSIEPLEEEEDNSPTRNPQPVINSISPESANVGGGSKNVTITGNGFIPSSTARWNGADRPTTFIDSSHLLIHLNSADMQGSSGRYITVWNRAPGGGYSNSAFFTINGYVAPNAGNRGNTGTRNNTQDVTGDVEGASDENYSDLASNVIFGSNTFMPSGIVQWLLFAIFILLVVIIVRKLFLADKYHAKPLKHA